MWQGHFLYNIKCVDIIKMMNVLKKIVMQWKTVTSFKNIFTTCLSFFIGNLLFATCAPVRGIKYVETQASPIHYKCVI